MWGALGGSLMGIGAVLAGGCTVGAFLVPTLHASPSGFVMLAGLMIGAVIGLKLLMWTLEHITWGMRAPVPKPLSPITLRLYPWLGLIVVVGILGWATSCNGLADEKIASRAIIVLAGFAIGFVMRRSRFWVGSIAHALFAKSGLTVAEMNLDMLEESKLGIQAFFPTLLDGWGWTYLAIGALLLLWYLLVRYNESSEKFTVV